MKRIYIIITIALTTLLLTSCSDYLDKELDSVLSEEKVFTNPEQTRNILIGIYTYIPDGLDVLHRRDNQFHGALRDVLSDNAITSWNIHIYHRMVQNTFTAQSNPMDYIWTDNWTVIRRCNLFMEHSHRSGISNASVGGDDNRLLDRYNTEARLLRALYHFELAKYYGDIPISTKTIDITNEEETNMFRTPATEVFDWIAAECDAVKDILPFYYESEGNWGRVSGAFAYALKSRALLYKASAFFNPSNNAQWWSDAAQAAQDFMTKNATLSQPFGLYTGGGATSYQELFYMLPFLNNEVIMSTAIRNTMSIERNLLPEGFNGVSGRIDPTQEFVDCFEMANGMKITDPGSGYNPQNPYANRDPRLEQSVFYHDMEYGYPTSRKLDMSVGGIDANQGSNFGTFTGYYLKKYCNPAFNTVDATLQRNQAHAWILFRYAEILLNYAEARNEALGAPDESVYSAINQIRSRAGMPGLPEGLSKEQMRDRIRNERRVELSFEEHRYFDVRRWRLFDDPVMREKMLDLHMMFINENGVYDVRPLSANFSRAWTDRLYLFPIPYADTQRAPNLGQNPGWAEQVGSYEGTV